MPGQFFFLQLWYGIGRGVLNVMSQIEYKSLGSVVWNRTFVFGVGIGD